jgi:hypothetical protein
MVMMDNVYHAIKGKSFIMKVDAAGKITEVLGLDEMQKAAMESIQTTDEYRPYFESGFKSQFNQESLKQSFEQVLNIYPAKPVKTGDSWQKEMTLGMMKMKTTFTVESIDKDKVMVDASSSFDMMGSTGTQKGTYEIDARTGLVTSAQYNQVFEGPMKMTVDFRVTGKVVGQ